MRTAQSGDAQNGTAHAAPLDARTFAVGVLSVTATVLFVGLLMVANTRPAYGIGMSDRSGDYIMVTMQISNSMEGIAVIDAAARRMNIYALEPNTKKIGIIEQNVRLEQLPGAQNP